MPLLGLVTILLLAFVVHLHRRVRKLELTLAGAAPPIEQIEPAEPATAQQPSLPEAEKGPADLVSVPRVQAETWELVAEPGESRMPKIRFAFSVEDLFGRRLPIWAGGITLAVAGIFIVKLSIEAGLLSPPVRVIGGMIFGGALIAGAELALRFHDRVRDARVRQALSGAGIASLYASILVAANLYHLIQPALAMIGIAGVTGAAMLLSIRLGAPSALLGLAGGLSAPALIGSTNPNVPLLTLYLAFAVAGLSVLSRGQRWAWLAVGALTGGFAWGAILLFTSALDASSSIAVGLYLLLIGVGLPLLGMGSEKSDRLQLIAGLAGAVGMAALVANGGFSLLNWGLFGAIAVAIAWLSTRDRSFERLPAVSLTIAMLLAGWWPATDWQSFALVLVGIALIHAPMPVRRLWSRDGGTLDAAQIALLGLGTWVASMRHFHLSGANDNVLGFLAVSLAFATGTLAAIGFRAPGRQEDARFAIVTTAAGLLLCGASTLLLPGWSFGVATGAIGFVLLELGNRANDRRLAPIAWIFAGAGFLAGVVELALSTDWHRNSVHSGLISVVAALFAWRGRHRAPRAVAQFVAATFVYFAIAPWLDEPVRPALAGLILIAAASSGRYLRDERLFPALTASFIIILGWALPPLAHWVEGASVSLVGQPLLVTAVPSVESAVARLLVPGVLAASALYVASGRLRAVERVSAISLVTLFIGVGVHSLYKHVFAIGGSEAFIRLGLTERTIWQALLFAGAAAAVRFRRKEVAQTLGGSAMFHFAVYSLLLHNALWTAQSVGFLPIANLLLASYGMPLVALAMLGRLEKMSELSLRAISLAQMLLLSLLAFSELRQLFHGSVLVGHGLSQGEDIARSIMAIALAVGFLLWGITRKNRDWRVGSLVLMLAAVGKVFLFDASGLEGVTRIASFVALGLSLIGIGWLYSRFLPAGEAELASAV